MSRAVGTQEFEAGRESFAEELIEWLREVDDEVEPPTVREILREIDSLLGWDGD